MSGKKLPTVQENQCFKCLSAFETKYSELKTTVNTLKELVAWILTVRDVKFDQVWVQRVPELKDGLKASLVLPYILPVQDSFAEYFHGKEALTSKLIGLFHRALALIVLDQSESLRTIQSGMHDYVFGFLPNKTVILQIICPDQIVIGFSEHGLTFSSNLGQRVGFSFFLKPPGIPSQNSFFSTNNELLPPEQFLFGLIELKNSRDENLDLLAQNKILAMQQSTLMGSRGGVIVIKGIPSTEFLDWLIQKNVQEVPHAPNVEVVVLLNLPIAGNLPYLLTIKPAKLFRWKKDNANRYWKNLFPREARNATTLSKREISQAYRTAKNLIKANLKWIPAHELFIQLNKDRIDNIDVSDAFWQMVELKEAHSGLPRTQFSSISSHESFLTEHVRQFTQWMVDMANNKPENVPLTVRAPLRPEIALKRLESIDSSCIDPNGKNHTFPSEERIHEIVARFMPIFEEIQRRNTMIEPNCTKLYHLPMAPIIGDFLANHIDWNQGQKEIKNLKDLTTEMLEDDFKSQVNYSYDQVVYCLRYSIEENKIQGSKHVAARSKYETLDEVACETEKSFFQFYQMCLLSLPLEGVKNQFHYEAMSDLIDKILLFRRGCNVRVIWNIFYSGLAKTNHPNKEAAKVLHTQIFSKLNNVKKDCKIEKIQDFQQYYKTLYECIQLSNQPLQFIIQIIETQMRTYEASATSFQQHQPILFQTITSLRPISEVPQLTDILLPILFENIAPTYLPVRKTDRILILTLPPASLAIHWVKYIYIVEPSGNVKISPEMISGKKKGKRLSHSQLAGWGPVQAAGEVYFSKDGFGNWQCIQVNNGSGHYEPDAEGSLLIAKSAIQAALLSTQIQFIQDNVAVRNVLLPGVPAHSFLKDTNT